MRNKDSILLLMALLAIGANANYQLPYQAFIDSTEADTSKWIIDGANQKCTTQDQYGDGTNAQWTHNLVWTTDSKKCVEDVTTNPKSEYFNNMRYVTFISAEGILASGDLVVTPQPQKCYRATEDTSANVVIVESDFDIGTKTCQETAGNYELMNHQGDILYTTNLHIVVVDHDRIVCKFAGKLYNYNKQFGTCILRDPLCQGEQPDLALDPIEEFHYFDYPYEVYFWDNLENRITTQSPQWIQVLDLSSGICYMGSGCHTDQIQINKEYNLIQAYNDYLLHNEMMLTMDPQGQTTTFFTYLQSLFDSPFMCGYNQVQGPVILGHEMFVGFPLSDPQPGLLDPTIPYEFIRIDLDFENDSCEAVKVEKYPDGTTNDTSVETATGIISELQSGNYVCGNTQFYGQNVEQITVHLPTAADTQALNALTIAFVAIPQPGNYYSHSCWYVDQNGAGVIEGKYWYEKSQQKHMCEDPATMQAFGQGPVDTYQQKMIIVKEYPNYNSYTPCWDDNNDSHYLIEIHDNSSDDVCFFQYFDGQQTVNAEWTYSRDKHTCTDPNDATMIKNMHKEMYQIKNKLTAQGSSTQRAPIIFDMQNSYCLSVSPCQSRHMKVDRQKLHKWRFESNTDVMPFICQDQPNKIQQGDVLIAAIDVFETLVFDFNNNNCVVTKGTETVTGTIDPPYCNVNWPHPTGSTVDTTGAAIEVVNNEEFLALTTVAKYAQEIKGGLPALKDTLASRVMEGTYRGENQCMVSTEKCIAGRIDQGADTVTYNKVVDANGDEGEYMGIFDGQSCRYDIAPPPTGFDLPTGAELIMKFDCDSYSRMPSVPFSYPMDTCMRIHFQQQECSDIDDVVYDLDLVDFTCTEQGNTSATPIQMAENEQTHWYFGGPQYLIDLNARLCIREWRGYCESQQQLDIDWQLYDEMRAATVTNSVFAADGSIVYPSIDNMTPELEDQLWKIPEVFKCQMEWKDDYVSADWQHQWLEHKDMIFVGKIDRPTSNEILIIDSENMKCINWSQTTDPAATDFTLDFVNADANGELDPRDWKCVDPNDATTFFLVQNYKVKFFNLISYLIGRELDFVLDTFNNKCYGTDGDYVMEYGLVVTNWMYKCSTYGAPDQFIWRDDWNYELFGYDNTCQYEQETCDNGDYPWFEPYQLADLYYQQDLSEIIENILSFGQGWVQEEYSDYTPNLNEWKFIYGQHINMQVLDNGDIVCIVHYGCEGEVQLAFDASTMICSDAALGIEINLAVNSFELHGATTPWIIDLIRGVCYRQDSCNVYEVYSDATLAAAGEFKCIPYMSNPADTTQTLSSSSTDATIIGSIEVHDTPIIFNLMQGFDEGYMGGDDDKKGSGYDDDKSSDGDGDGFGDDNGDGDDGYADDNTDPDVGPDGSDYNGDDSYNGDDDASQPQWTDPQADNDDDGFQGYNPNQNNSTFTDDDAPGFRRRMRMRRLGNDSTDGPADGYDGSDAQEWYDFFFLEIPYQFNKMSFFQQEITNNNIYQCSDATGGNSSMAGGNPGDCWVTEVDIPENYRGQFIKEISACVLQNEDGTLTITKVRNYNDITITPNEFYPEIFALPDIRTCFVGFNDVTDSSNNKICEFVLNKQNLEQLHDFNPDDTSATVMPDEPFECHCEDTTGTVDIIPIPLIENIGAQNEPYDAQGNYTPPPFQFVSNTGIEEMIYRFWDGQHDCQIPYMIDFSAQTPVCMVGDIEVPYDAAAFTCDGNDLATAQWEINLDTVSDARQGFFVDIWNMRAIDTTLGIPYRVQIIWSDWSKDDTENIVLTRTEDTEIIKKLKYNQGVAIAGELPITVVGRREGRRVKVNLTRQCNTNAAGDEECDVVPHCEHNPVTGTGEFSGKYDDRTFSCFDDNTGELFANIFHNKDLQITGIANAVNDQFTIVSYPHKKCFVSGANDGPKSYNMQTSCHDKMPWINCVDNNGMVVKNFTAWEEDKTHIFNPEFFYYTQQCEERFLTLWLEEQGGWCDWGDQGLHYNSTHFACQDQQNNLLKLTDYNYRIESWPKKHEGTFLIDRWQQACYHEDYCIAFDLKHKGEYTTPSGITKAYYVCELRRGSEIRFRFEVKDYVVFGKTGLENPPGWDASTQTQAQMITKLDFDKKECQDDSNNKIGNFKIEAHQCQIDGQPSVSVKAIQDVAIVGHNQYLTGDKEALIYLNKCYKKGIDTPCNFSYNGDEFGGEYYTCTCMDATTNEIVDQITYQKCDLGLKVKAFGVKLPTRCWTPGELWEYNFHNLLSVLDVVNGNCAFKWINWKWSENQIEFTRDVAAACGGYEQWYHRIESWHPACPLDTPPTDYDMTFEDITKIQSQLDMETGYCNKFPVDSLPNMFLYSVEQNAGDVKEGLLYHPTKACVKTTVGTDDVVLFENAEFELEKVNGVNIEKCNIDGTLYDSPNDLIKVGPSIFLASDESIEVNVYSNRCKIPDTVATNDPPQDISGTFNNWKGKCFMKDTGVVNLCKHLDQMVVDFNEPDQLGDEQCVELQSYEAAVLTCNEAQGPVGHCIRNDGVRGFVSDVLVYNLFWRPEDNEYAQYLTQDLQDSQDQLDQFDQCDIESGIHPIKPQDEIIGYKLCYEFDCFCDEIYFDSFVDFYNMVNDIYSTLTGGDAGQFVFPDVSATDIDSYVDNDTIFPWIELYIEFIESIDFGVGPADDVQFEESYICFNEMTDAAGNEFKMQYINLWCEDGTTAEEGFVSFANHDCYVQQNIPLHDFFYWIPEQLHDQYYIDDFVGLSCDQGRSLLIEMALVGAELEPSITCKFPTGQQGQGPIEESFNPQSIKVLNREFYEDGFNADDFADANAEAPTIFIINQQYDSTADQFSYECIKVNEWVDQYDMTHARNLYDEFIAGSGTAETYDIAANTCGGSNVNTDYVFLPSLNASGIDVVVDPRKMRCYTDDQFWFLTIKLFEFDSCQSAIDNEIMKFQSCGANSNVVEDFMVLGSFKLPDGKVEIDLVADPLGCSGSLDGVDFDFTLDAEAGLCVGEDANQEYVEIPVCARGIHIPEATLEAYFSDTKSVVYDFCSYTCHISAQKRDGYIDGRWYFCGADDFGAFCCNENDADAVIFFTPDEGNIAIAANSAISSDTAQGAEDKEFVFYFFEDTLPICLDQHGRIYIADNVQFNGLITGHMYCYPTDNLYDLEQIMAVLDTNNIYYKPDEFWYEPQYWAGLFEQEGRYNEEHMWEDFAGFDYWDCPHTFQFGLETVNLALDRPEVNRKMFFSIRDNSCYPHATNNWVGSFDETTTITLSSGDITLEQMFNDYVDNWDAETMEVEVTCTDGTQTQTVKVKEIFFLGFQNSFNPSVVTDDDIDGYFLRYGPVQTFQQPDFNDPTTDFLDWQNTNGSEVYQIFKTKAYSCSGSCGTCSDSPDQCTNCPADSTKCFDMCVVTADIADSGFYLDGQDCVECPQNCQTCPQGTCTDCYSSTYLDSNDNCVEEFECMMDGGYVNYELNTCVTCGDGIQECFGVNDGSGTYTVVPLYCGINAAGDQLYMKEDGSCVTSTNCGSRHIGVKTLDGIHICMECDVKCGSCSGDTEMSIYNCDTCNSPAYEEQNGDCQLAGCDPGEFGDASGACQSCSAACGPTDTNCSTDVNYCFECNNKADANGDIAGYLAMNDDGFLYCYTEAECNAQTSKNAHATSITYEEGTETITEGVCLYCDDACDGACDKFGPEGCTEGCVQSSDFTFFVSGLGCLSECPEGTVETSTGVCGCPTDCDICYENGNGDQLCEICSGDNLLTSDGTGCTTSCETNESEVMTASGQKKCKQCPTDCATCETLDNGVSCISCNNNKNIQNNPFTQLNQCIDGCSNGFYPDNGECVTCITDFSLTGECVQQNDGSWVIDSDNASVCDDNCGTCLTESDDCSSCNYGQVLAPQANSDKMQCIDQTACTDTTTSSVARRILQRDCPVAMSQFSCDQCVKCPSECGSCSETNGCDTCAQGFSKSYGPLNACTQECGEGFFNQNNSGICQVCNSSCKDCEDAQQCSVCYPNQSLYSIPVGQSSTTNQQVASTTGGTPQMNICVCNQEVTVETNNIYTEITFSFPSGLAPNMLALISNTVPDILQQPSLEELYKSYRKTLDVVNELGWSWHEHIQSLVNDGVIQLPQGQLFYDILEQQSMEELVANKHQEFQKIARQFAAMVNHPGAPQQWIKQHFGSWDQSILDFWMVQPDNIQINENNVNNGGLDLVAKLFPVQVRNKFSGYSQHVTVNDDGSWKLKVTLPDNHSITPTDKIWFNNVLLSNNCFGMIKRDYLVKLNGTTNPVVTFKYQGSAGQEHTIAPCSEALVEIGVTGAIQNYSSIVSKSYTITSQTDTTVTYNAGSLATLAQTDAFYDTLNRFNNIINSLSSSDRIIKVPKADVENLSGYNVKIQLGFNFKYVTSTVNKSVTLKFDGGSNKSLTIMNDNTQQPTIDASNPPNNYKLNIAVTSCGSDVPNLQQFLKTQVDYSITCTGNLNADVTDDITINPNNRKVFFPPNKFLDGETYQCTVAVDHIDSNAGFTGDSKTFTIHTFNPPVVVFTEHLDNPIKILATQEVEVLVGLLNYDIGNSNYVVNFKCNDSNGNNCDVSDTALNGQTWWDLTSIKDAAFNGIYQHTEFTEFSVFAPVFPAGTFKDDKTYVFTVTVKRTSGGTTDTFSNYFTIKTLNAQTTDEVLGEFKQIGPQKASDGYLDPTKLIKFDLIPSQPIPSDATVEFIVTQATNSQMTQNFVTIADDGSKWSIENSPYHSIKFSREYKYSSSFQSKYFQITCRITSANGHITEFYQKFNTFSSITLDEPTITPEIGVTTQTSVKVVFGNAGQGSSTQAYDFVVMYVFDRMQAPLEVIQYTQTTTLNPFTIGGTGCLETEWNCKLVILVKTFYNGETRIRPYLKDLHVEFAEPTPEILNEAIATVTLDNIGSVMSTIDAASTVTGSMISDIMSAASDMLADANASGDAASAIPTNVLQQTAGLLNNDQASGTQAADTANLIVTASISAIDSAGSIQDEDTATQLADTVTQLIQFQTNQDVRRRLQDDATDPLYGEPELPEMNADKLAEYLKTSELTNKLGTSLGNKIQQATSNYAHAIAGGTQTFEKDGAPICSVDTSSASGDVTIAFSEKQPGLGTNSSVLTLQVSQTTTNGFGQDETSVKSGEKGNIVIPASMIPEPPVTADDAATGDEGARRLEETVVELRQLENGEWVYVQDCTKDGDSVTCEGIDLSGTYSFFPKGLLPITKDGLKTERLYKGFILYVCILIDILLICGAVFGSRLDSASRKVDIKVTEEQKQSKMYTGVDADEKWATKPKEGESHVNVKESDVPHPNPSGPQFSSGNSIKLYHRCSNIITSPYHELTRPLRALSFCLQLMIMTLIIGAAIELMPEGPQIGAAVGIAFVFTRLTNFVFNSLLTCAHASGGVLKALVIIALTILFLGCHGIAIYIALGMSDPDFTHYTIAFFVSLVIEVIVWELIVAAWQHKQMANQRESKALCCKFAVSRALMRAYFV